MSRWTLYPYSEMFYIKLVWFRDFVNHFDNDIFTDGHSIKVRLGSQNGNILRNEKHDSSCNLHD